MNISMQLTVVVVAACLCLADSAPDGRLVRKQQRPTRGFKNVEMMTARGFGKRDRPHTRTETPFSDATARRKFDPKNSLMVAYDFGKRSNDFSDEVVDMDDFLEALASPEKEGQDIEDKTESMPLELLVLEMMNNPDFTRSVVRKFIDINQDGMLSLDELLRNVA